MTPKMTLNTMRSKVPHICYTITPKSQISFILLYNHLLSSYRPFRDKCIECPPNDLRLIIINTIFKRSKVLHIHFTSTQLGPIFHSVSLYGQPFSSTGHCETSLPNDPQITLNTKRSMDGQLKDPSVTTSTSSSAAS